MSKQILINRQIWYYLARLSNLNAQITKPDLAADAVPDLRSRLKDTLKEAHTYLLTRTTERNAYFVIFAFVAWLDETIQESRLSGQAVDWYPLQVELFDITDAGTLFYNYIDYFLGRNDIPFIIHEVYFFCLKDGFKGSKISEPELRQAYMQELKALIPEDQPPKIVDRSQLHEMAKKRVPTYAYYLLAFLPPILLRIVLEFIPLEIAL